MSIGADPDSLWKTGARIIWLDKKQKSKNVRHYLSRDDDMIASFVSG